MFPEADLPSQKSSSSGLDVLIFQSLAGARSKLSPAMTHGST